MRRLAVILSTVALLAAGAAIAVAGGGGSTHYGNAGHDQYHEKPGCGPDKTDGYAGGSGYHDGQPPKDDNRGDCPNPPGQCDHSHFSSFYFAGGSSHNDDCGDNCDNHRYSNYNQGKQGNGGGSKGDCRSSSPAGSPVELSRV